MQLQAHTLAVFFSNTRFLISIVYCNQVTQQQTTSEEMTDHFKHKQQVKKGVGGGKSGWGGDREGDGRLGRWLGTGTGLNCRHGKQQQQAPSSFGKGRRSNLIKVCVCVCFQASTSPCDEHTSSVAIQTPQKPSCFRVRQQPQQ